MRGVATRAGEAHGEQFIHVGAPFGELEFCRYAPRRALAAMIEDSDLIQVVAGVPVWAGPVIGLGKPVALQVATLLKTERQSKLPYDRFPTREWRRLMTHFVERIDTATLQAVDAVLVENPWMFEHASRTMARPGAIVRYAPPGVDTQFFHPAERPAEDPADGNYIVAVGRFADLRKDVGLLLESFAIARRAEPGLRLVIVDPDGPGAAFHRKLVELELGEHVEVRPRVDDEELAHLYRNALALAVASREEGFGMTVIEAMASGIPIVSTKCGGPEGIITDGKNGFLVDVGDAGAMAKSSTRSCPRCRPAPGHGRAGAGDRRRTVFGRKGGRGVPVGLRRVVVQKRCVHQTKLTLARAASAASPCPPAARCAPTIGQCGAGIGVAGVPVVFWRSLPMVRCPDSSPTRGCAALRAAAVKIVKEKGDVG